MTQEYQPTGDFAMDWFRTPKGKQLYYFLRKNNIDIGRFMAMKPNSRMKVMDAAGILRSGGGPGVTFDEDIAGLGRAMGHGFEWLDKPFQRPPLQPGVANKPTTALMQPMASPRSSFPDANRGEGNAPSMALAPQVQAGIAAPAPASRGPASIVQQGVAQDPTNAMPMYYDQNNSPKAGVLRNDFTDSLKVEADAQAPAAEVSAADRTAGSAFLGMGLQMMGDGATAPAFEEQLGGIGMTVAGIAKLAGVGGKWAAPVAVLGALTNMAGMRKSAKMEGDHKARIFRSYAKALASAGSLYRGR